MILIIYHRSCLKSLVAQKFKNISNNHDQSFDNQFLLSTETQKRRLHPFVIQLKHAVTSKGGRVDMGSLKTTDESYSMLVLLEVFVATNR